MPRPCSQSLRSSVRTVAFRAASANSNLADLRAHTKRAGSIFANTRLAMSRACYPSKWWVGLNLRCSKPSKFDAPWSPLQGHSRERHTALSTADTRDTFLHTRDGATPNPTLAVSTVHNRVSACAPGKQPETPGDKTREQFAQIRKPDLAGGQ